MDPLALKIGLSFWVFIALILVLAPLRIEYLSEPQTHIRYERTFIKDGQKYEHIAGPLIFSGCDTPSLDRVNQYLHIYDNNGNEVKVRSYEQLYIIKRGCFGPDERWSVIPLYERS